MDAGDEQLLDKLQRAAFDYFLTYTNPGNGLVADTSRENSPASIAVVGFALAAYPVAVERGWMVREEAAAVTLRTLRFFLASQQSQRPNASGFGGFYYHFLNMRTGMRVWQCELSLVDSALLLAGMLVSESYFNSDTGEETQIREVAQELYRRMDWTWAMNGTDTLAQGWKPECGFLHYGWEGYNEAVILYVLALGAPGAAISPQGYAGWCKTYQWEKIYGHDVLYGGPLFMHLFSHAWIDFRGIKDDFMREKNFDYFRNTCAAIAIQREYAHRNPWAFKPYGRDCWGITAGDGPNAELIRRDDRDLRHYGYAARGVPFGPDDGTLAPWAMLACLPFDSQAALAGTRYLLEHHPQTCSDFRFSSGFNLNVDASQGWLSEGAYGLDQGVLVLMIENYRSGLIWKLMRGSEPLRRGLLRAGFRGGWLESHAH